MAHAHTHSAAGGNIKLAFFLNLGFAIIEVVGGLFTGSIAILSDALHDFGDSLSLGLGWYLEKKAEKGSTATYSFGYRRFSLLSALINVVVLIIGSIFVIREAISKLSEPGELKAEWMIPLAVLGIIVNGIAAYRLKGGQSLNKQVLTWHLLEDILGWVAVLIVSIVLLFKNIPVLDPILALAITAFVLFNIIKRLKKTMEVFLQKVPETLNLAEIEQKFTAIKNVRSVHHAHIWSLDGEHHVLTAHLKLSQVSGLEEILAIKNQVKDVLTAYPLEHVTIETELENEVCTMEKMEHTAT